MAPPQPEKKTRTRKPAAVKEAAAPALANVPAVAEAPAPGPDLNNQVARIEDKDTAVVVATSAIGQVAGNITSEDLRIPRLTLVQSVGDLSASFDAGAFVLDGEFELIPMPEDRALRTKQSTESYFIPLKMSAVYRENLDYNDPEQKNAIPKEFAEVDDVIADGGKVEYGPGFGCFQRALNVLGAFVNVEPDGIPAGLEGYFVDQVDGLDLCVCAFRLFKSSFNSAGKTLLTDAVRIMSKHPAGSLGSLYSIHSERRQTGSGNWIWVPVVRRQATGPSADVIKYLSETYS